MLNGVEQTSDDENQAIEVLAQFKKLTFEASQQRPLNNIQYMAYNPRFGYRGQPLEIKADKAKFRNK